MYIVYKRPTLDLKIQRLKVKRQKKIFYGNRDQKRAEVDILIGQNRL